MIVKRNFGNFDFRVDRSSVSLQNLDYARRRGATGDRVLWSRLQLMSFSPFLSFEVWFVWRLRACLFFTLLLSACQNWTPHADDAELLRSAIKAIEVDDISRAKSLLDELLKQNPHHSKALMYRAQLARDDGDDKTAIDLLKSVDNVQKKIGGTARYLEGAIAASLGQARLAESKWLKSIELHPLYPQPREALSKLYLLQYRGEEAETMLWSLRQVRPWTLQEHVMWQLSRTGNSHATDAIEQLENYVRAEPDNLVSRTALARRLLTLERLDDAITVLTPELKGKSTDSRVLGMWAYIHWRKGDVVRVLKSLPCQWPSDDADEWLWRAYAQIATDGGDSAGAAACWWRVVRSVPDDREANYHLAQALERCGFNDAAANQFTVSRNLEELFDHVQHMLDDNARRVDLASFMVSRIISTLEKLHRPQQAVVWAQLLFTWNPSDVRLREGIESLIQAGSDSLPAIQFRDLGQRLAMKRPQVPAFEADFTHVGRITKSHDDNETPIRLEDIGPISGLDFQHFNGPTEFKYLLESLGGAVAVLDFDCDDWPDFYFPQGCSIPYTPDNQTHLDQLFRNRGDNQFQRVTSESRIVENRYSQGVAAGDFNNDGFPDLFVANFGPNSFFQNNGDGTFTEVSTRVGFHGDDWSSSAAWADLDGDGDLDLYVVKYLADPFKVCRKPTREVAACSPGNFQGAADQLYVNCGDGTFVERLNDSGMEAFDGKGLGVVIADFDDDGRPDVYVANDGTPNFLFHNIGNSKEGWPRFQEIGMPSGCALSKDGRAQAGMGIACADLNGDGLMDLYVTNFYEDYNTLYINRGELFFEDFSRQAGLVEPTMQMLGFGTQAIDFDLDRKPDLIVANGHIDDHSSEGIPWKMTAQVFRNVGEGAFVDSSSTVGNYFRRPVLGRAVARVDTNRDGRPDAVIVNQDCPVALLENRTSVENLAVTIHLIGTTSNREAINTRLTAEFDDSTKDQYQLCGGDGYFATNERKMLIGTGSSKRIQKLLIRWPSGQMTELNDLHTGQRVIAIEGRGTVVNSTNSR